jgi:hypothetical protein
LPDGYIFIPKLSILTYFGEQQVCQMDIHFHTKNINFDILWKALGVENCGIFRGLLVYFVVLWYFCGLLVFFVVFWYISWSFGIFRGLLVFFVVFWYFSWSFGIFRGLLVFFVVFVVSRKTQFFSPKILIRTSNPDEFVTKIAENVARAIVCQKCCITMQKSSQKSGLLLQLSEKLHTSKQSPKGGKLAHSGHPDSANFSN